ELLFVIGDYEKHGSIRIYDTSDFSEIKQLLPGHTAPCSQICFSRDGQNMASVDSDGTILLWDWKRRSIVERVAPRNEKKSVFDGLFFPTDKPYILGIDFDGPHIMSAATGQRLGARDEMPNEVRGWLVDIFNKLVTFPFNTKKQPRVFDFRMERSVWAAAGVGREGGSNKFWVGIWESRGPQTTPNPATKLGQYSKHRWNVSTVEIGPRDNLVASGDKFGEVHVWNYKTGKRLFKFSGQGKPIYEVAFEDGSSRIAFGTRAYSPKEWKHNNHGRANKVLDLARRAILNADSIEGLRLNNEQPNRNGARVSVARTKTDNHFTVRFESSGSQTEYRISSGRNPTVYTLLDRATLGVTRPVVFGDNEGLLALWDSSGDELKRAFIGHDSLVSGISPSFNGKLLASGATDRTIRIWSLENYRPTGIFDFKFEDSTVREVVPGTSSAKAGVQVGDKIESIDGKTLREMFDLMLEGKFDYRPGQSVPVVMRRGSTYSYDMKLTDGYDFVDPLLNVFIGDEDQWIIWSPQGYYDASPGADELIGWHVNRGPDKSARFYKVQQFQEQLYRPDIIDRILETGSLERALNDSKTVKHKRSEEDSIDLRDTREFAKSIPPVVKFQEPVRGSVRKEATLPVKCDVKSVNGLPIKEVTLLHNGSVAKVFRPKQNNSRQMSIEHNLKLVPGQNQVSVIAANARSKSANEEVQVVYQTRKPRSLGDAYVLSVGVSKFADQESDLETLGSAGSDAQALVKVLKANAGGKLYNKVHTRLLTNEQANRGDILDGFQWLVDNVKDGDTVMVFLSTYALVDSRDNFYLASHDAKAGRARSSAVAWRDLTDTLHFDLPDCKRMLLLDLRATKSAIKKGLRSPLLDLASPEQGTTFLSSNTLQELADAKSKNERSAFVQAILKTVRDQRSDVVPDAGDSLFNPVEFASGVTSYVQEMTDDNQHPVFYAPMAARRINVLELQK
ncbi:MAG: PDZ domain-containing protein, partial [Planctomycetota bacterium]